MKTFLIVLLIIGVIGISALGVSGYMPGNSGVVSSKTLSDGTELVIAQQFSSEPGYEVGFYIKPQGEPWGWCYLDHEDSAWRNGRIEFDAESDIVLVWKGSTLRGRWHKGTDKWERPNISGWIADAPQELRNPPFQPKKANKSEMATPNLPSD